MVDGGCERVQENGAPGARIRGALSSAEATKGPLLPAAVALCVARGRKVSGRGNGADRVQARQQKEGLLS